MPPKPLSYFKYQGIELQKPPEKEEQCQTDLETTAWIVDQLRQSSWNSVRRIIDANPVRHISSSLKILLTLTSPSRLSAGFGSRRSSGVVQLLGLRPGNSTAKPIRRLLLPLFSPSAQLHSRLASNAPHLTAQARLSIAILRAWASSMVHVPIVFTPGPAISARSVKVSLS